MQTPIPNEAARAFHAEEKISRPPVPLAPDIPNPLSRDLSTTKRQTNEHAGDGDRQETHGIEVQRIGRAVDRGVTELAVLEENLYNRVTEHQEPDHGRNRHVNDDSHGI
jgi:hypothetical protein